MRWFIRPQLDWLPVDLHRRETPKKAIFKCIVLNLPHPVTSHRFCKCKRKGWSQGDRLVRMQTDHHRPLGTDDLNLRGQPRVPLQQNEGTIILRHPDLITKMNVFSLKSILIVSDSTLYEPEERRWHRWPKGRCTCLFLELPTHVNLQY